MSLERALIPLMASEIFYDPFFTDIDRNVMRLHHDLRNAMTRLEAREPISAMNSQIQQQLNDLRSPLTKKEDGSQALDLSIDLSHYKPEEITIKTAGRELKIHARHEEKTDNSSVVQEINRRYTLPANIDPKQISSKLSKDGILTISGPVGDKAIETEIKPAIENK